MLSAREHHAHPYDDENTLILYCRHYGDASTRHHPYNALLSITHHRHLDAGRRHPREDDAIVVVTPLKPVLIFIIVSPTPALMFSIIGVVMVEGLGPKTTAGGGAGRTGPPLTIIACPATT